ncbi:MAG: hypothetical protein J6386_10920 [Candidatus Synoicihabitans palmerolidicus]|nr:hypothetical protein [Candidatus Synoicihabitans palmerolidicus]
MAKIVGFIDKLFVRADPADAVKEHEIGLKKHRIYEVDDRQKKACLRMQALLQQHAIKVLRGDALRTAVFVSERFGHRTFVRGIGGVSVSGIHIFREARERARLVATGN